MKKKLQIWLFPLIALVLPVIDLLTKNAIYNKYPFGQPVSIWGNFLRFTVIYNKGVTFGIFNNSKFEVMPYILAALAVVALVVVFFIYFNIEKYIKPGVPVTLARIALMFVAGGALGNIPDRLFLFNGDGHLTVLDFIDMGIGNVRWFVYNIADASVVVGSIGLAILFLLFEIKKEQAPDNKTAA